MSTFRLITIHAFVRQTDRRTDRQTDIFVMANTTLHSIQQGKKVTIAMHCNLRPPHVAPVVQHLNYEADTKLEVRQPIRSCVFALCATHNEPMYKISAKSNKPRQSYASTLKIWRPSAISKLTKLIFKIQRPIHSLPSCET